MHDSCKTRCRPVSYFQYVHCADTAVPAATKALHMLSYKHFAVLCCAVLSRAVLCCNTIHPSLSLILQNRLLGPIPYFKHREPPCTEISVLLQLQLLITHYHDAVSCAVHDSCQQRYQAQLQAGHAKTSINFNCSLHAVMPMAIVLCRAWQLQAQAPALRATRSLYNELYHKGFSVTFLTGR